MRISEDGNYQFTFLDGRTKEFATLREANLKGADLFNTSVFSFQLGKHFAFYHEGYLKIGCEGHYLDHWLEHVGEIGRKYGYSEEDIGRYKIQINALKEMN